MPETFYIQSLDALAQGVSKSAQQRQITFIAKTLLGETVRAEVLVKRKQVSEAKVIAIDIPSDKRVDPACPHYQSCPSCHLLHTSYTHELELKQQALQQQLEFLAQHSYQSLPEIDVIASPERHQYRNRVQLHYRHRYIGFIDRHQNRVIEVPQCKILRPELQQAFDRLYQEKSWLEQDSDSGHVELYWQDNAVQIEWNQAYAAGGFSQVNQAVNQHLVASTFTILQQLGCESLLDLFSGQGNLSQQYVDHHPCQRIMVDICASQQADYCQLNLFDDDAFERFSRRVGKIAIDTLLIDPPRAGFKQLAFWLKRLKPKHLIYISCNPQSLARDLKNLTANGTKFKVETIQLFDMFPGTYHFETLVQLSFKRHAK